MRWFGRRDRLPLGSEALAPAPTAAPRPGEAFEVVEPQGRVLPEPVSIACVSGKGGVGKTTTTINLAAALAELGLEVLAVDCDPQSNLTSGLGLDPYRLDRSVGDVIRGEITATEAVQETSWPGLSVLPATPDLSAVEASLPSSLGRERRLHDAMRRPEIEDRFDVVVYDTPPNFGFHTVNVLGATRTVLVPLQMSGFAMRGLKELLRVVNAARGGLNPDLQLLGVVPTFVNVRTRLSRDMLAALCDLVDVPVFDVHVPVTVKLQESALLGVPVTSLAAASPAAEAYRRLAAEVLAAAQRPAHTESLLHA